MALQCIQWIYISWDRGQRKFAAESEVLILPASFRWPRSREGHMFMEYTTITLFIMIMHCVGVSIHNNARVTCVVYALWYSSCAHASLILVLNKPKVNRWDHRPKIFINCCGHLYKYLWTIPLIRNQSANTQPVLECDVTKVLVTYMFMLYIYIYIYMHIEF